MPGYDLTCRIPGRSLCYDYSLAQCSVSLRFSSLIRAGFGVCLEAQHISWFLCPVAFALIAENLFLRKQLAFYQERQIRPCRLSDSARFSLVLWSRFCNWKSVLVIVKPGGGSYARHSASI
jgi:hypothetical protein